MAFETNADGLFTIQASKGANITVQNYNTFQCELNYYRENQWDLPLESVEVEVDQAQPVEKRSILPVFRV